MRLLDDVDRHIDCTTRLSTASCDCSVMLNASTARLVVGVASLGELELV